MPVGYHYRLYGPGYAPWAFAPGRTPLDAGIPPPDPPPPSPPLDLFATPPAIVRVPWPTRAGPAAYAALLSATPRDQGAVPQGGPRRMKGWRQWRSAEEATAAGSRTPPDAGLTSPTMVLAHRAPGHIRTATVAYAGLVAPSPRDQGVAADPVFPRGPDRAPGRIRTAPAAYAGLLAPSPPDPGQVPAPPAVSHRVPAPARAAWLPPGTPSPPDAGQAPIAPAYPDRAPGRIRTAPAAYAGLVAPSPPDGGLPGIAPQAPPLAPGPARAATVAYAGLIAPTPPDQGSTAPYAGSRRMKGWRRWLSVEEATAGGPAPPPDAGIPQSIAVAPQAPDRAPGARRAAWLPASVPAPPDGGLAPPAAILASIAPGPRRAATVAYAGLVAPTPGDLGRNEITCLIQLDWQAPRGPAWAPSAVSPPPDPGVAPIAPALPRGVPGPARAAWMPAGVAPPPDAGQAPIAPRAPSLAPGPARGPATAYAATQGAGTPPDSGVVQDSVLAVVEPRPIGAARAAATAYAGLLAPSPPDLGITDLFHGRQPDVAPGPARAAWMQWTVAPPVDEGLPVMISYVDPAAAEFLADDASPGDVDPTRVTILD